MTDEEDEIRKMGAQLRLGLYAFVNAVWALVDEELADYPEARERVRLRLDAIRRRRSSNPRSRPDRQGRGSRRGYG